MATYAANVVDQARAWLGCKESNGTHKAIIALYNSHKPLARGYAVKYTDDWCATFVSAVAIKCGATDIIPTECSCIQMIELFKKLGCWVEDDNYSAQAGDIIFYDWEDSGKGDNVGSPNHVGIVESVSHETKTFTVIEGNKGEAVARRNIAINGKYIRGFGVPKYLVKEAAKVAVDNTPAKYAKEAVEWAVSNKILCGDESGNYKLHSNITVERMLVFLHRMYKLLKK